VLRELKVEARNAFRSEDAVPVDVLEAAFHDSRRHVELTSMLVADHTIIFSGLLAAKFEPMTRFDTSRRPRVAFSMDILAYGDH
jgi:hypothetical protein